MKQDVTDGVKQVVSDGVKKVAAKGEEVAKKGALRTQHLRQRPRQTAAATKLRPENLEALGFFHLLLRQAGAEQRPGGYILNGRKVRVVNGASAVLSKLRSQFVEAPTMVAADVTVAVGATDIGLPGNVVRSGRPGDFIRPAADGNWFDVAGARAELNI